MLDEWGSSAPAVGSIMKPSSKLLRQILLMMLSGALVFVSYPPLSWRWCILLAWVPLFYVVTHSSLRVAFFYPFYRV